MVVAAGILSVWTLVAVAQVRTQPVPPPSPCLQTLAAGTDAATGEICAGEEAGRLAGVAPKGSAERTRQLEAAAAHYRRAGALSSRAETKIRALDLLVQIYDAQHLNDQSQMEQALRARIPLTPEDLTPVYRLARLQEDEGLIDAAEETLVGARRQQPGVIEPYQMLAQFYARRAGVIHQETVKQEPRTATGPGERDENGVYRVGGPITSPSRLGVPKYPSDAQAARLQGVVVAEVVVDPAGNITDAKVVQSIPLLDDAALQAVRDWHYVPTLVNGEAVPVRMNVTVNFSLSTPPAPAAAPPAPTRR